MRRTSTPTPTPTTPSPPRCGCSHPNPHIRYPASSIPPRPVAPPHHRPALSPHPPPSPTTHTNHALRAWGFKLQTSEPPKLSPPLMLFNQVRRVRKQSPGFVRTTYLLHQKTTTTTRHTPPPPPPLPSSSSSFSAFPLPARSSSSYLPNAIGVVYA